MSEDTEGRFFITLLLAVFKQEPRGGCTVVKYVSTLPDRWAMMAVTGILGQELLGVTPAWWEAGAKEYDIPVIPLTAIQFTIMGFLETKRFQGFKQTGTVSSGSSVQADSASCRTKT